MLEGSRLAASKSQHQGACLSDFALGSERGENPKTFPLRTLADVSRARAPAR